ncbi:MAG: ABC transporter ATP-binding protein [Shinella sp.]|nr:ABC transporter ATP-binding protein [Shinella sp.]MDX3973505.1 ABC transporter ATP-binding protein [Shinella sp.]
MMMLGTVVLQPQGHICLRGVSKSYDGDTYIVRDLDLDIEKGEFLTLLGPSGSGKTTTLMMLAGFEFPTSGSIDFDGEAMQDRPPEKRDIGMVFQSYALFPHMSVAENVGYSLRVRGVAKAELDRRVRDALAMVQLEQFANRKPSALSGGQQQRVALARALVFEPRLVLMDEPLGALDKKLREDLQLEIRHIADKLDLTVVYVTHDQSEALTMSDRIAIFNDGKIQQIGNARDIYAAPANRFVASFVGDNNCLCATVEAIDGDIVRARLTSGDIVSAIRTDHAREGAAATIAIRPESIRFAGGDLPGVVKGHVADVVYYGDQIRIHVELSGGARIVTKSAPGTLHASTEIGAPVFLTWDALQARALDARQAKQ